MQVEREVQAIYRCILMKKHVGQELEGEVTSVAEHGVVVSLDAPFVEVKVPIDRVGEDYFELDRLGIALVGSRTGRRIALADRVRIRIDESSVDRREITATLLSGGSSGRARKGRDADRFERRREGARPSRQAPSRATEAKQGKRTGTFPRGKASRGGDGPERGGRRR